MVAAGATSTVIAQCPAGLSVTGGGEVTDSNDPAVNITASTWDTSGSGLPDLWFATVHNGSASSITLLVDAICTHPTTISAAAANNLGREAHR